MPAGIPQLEVEFLVDANGVLNVSAQERRSGRRAALQVVPNHGLTREEVEQMEAASLANAREDMARHRITDLIVNSKLDLKWIGSGSRSTRRSWRRATRRPEVADREPARDGGGGRTGLAIGGCGRDVPDKGRA
jgi:hypothetical protein